jgi:hypothetical protein
VEMVYNDQHNLFFLLIFCSFTQVDYHQDLLLFYHTVVQGLLRGCRGLLIPLQEIKAFPTSQRNTEVLSWNFETFMLYSSLNRIYDNKLKAVLTVLR